jgi:hypothetical protein
MDVIGLAPFKYPTKPAIGAAIAVARSAASNSFEAPRTFDSPSPIKPVELQGG